MIEVKIEEVIIKKENMYRPADWILELCEDVPDYESCPSIIAASGSKDSNMSSNHRHWLHLFLIREGVAIGIEHLDDVIACGALAGLFGSPHLRISEVISLLADSRVSDENSDDVYHAIWCRADAWVPDYARMRSSRSLLHEELLRRWYCPDRLLDMAARLGVSFETLICAELA